MKKEKTDDVLCEDSQVDELDKVRIESAKEDLAMKKVVFDKVKKLLNGVINITTEEQVNNIKALSELLKSTYF